MWHCPEASMLRTQEINARSEDINYTHMYSSVICTIQIVHCSVFSYIKVYLQIKITN